LTAPENEAPTGRAGSAFSRPTGGAAGGNGRVLSRNLLCAWAICVLQMAGQSGEIAPGERM